jgi:hypothetical protein
MSPNTIIESGIASRHTNRTACPESNHTNLANCQINYLTALSIGIYCMAIRTDQLIVQQCEAERSYSPGPYTAITKSDALAVRHVVDCGAQLPLPV